MARRSKAAAEAPVEDEVLEDEEILEDESEDKETAKAKKARELAEKKAERSAQYAETQQEVVRLKDDEGMKLGDIAKQLKLNPVTVQVMYIRATQEKTDLKPTPENVQKMRDEDRMAWARIGASFDPVMTKAQVQALYKQTGNDPHMSFVGRGGRYGKYEEHRPPSEPKPKKAAAKKASAATKKGAEGNGFLAADVSLDDLKAKVLNKTLHYNKNGAAAKAKVKEVTKIGTLRGIRTAQMVDANGQQFRVGIPDMVKVTR